MAYDERARRNVLGVWRGWVDTTAYRWEELANLWRTTGFPAPPGAPTAPATSLIGHTVRTMRDQLVDNWDSWNAVWFESGDALPSVIVTGPSGGLGGVVGTATVGPRLDGVALDGTVLERIGGPETISGTSPAAGAPGYALGLAGTYDGRVRATMIDNVGTAGTYRGLIRYRPPGAAEPEPLAWMFVVAE